MKIKFISTSLTSLLIQLDTPSINLSSENFCCTLDNTIFLDFQINKITPTSYNLIPDMPFNLSNIFEVFISIDGFTSNALTLFFLIPVNSDLTTLSFPIPSLPSGNYSLFIDTVNDFQVENSPINLVFCNGIDTETSNISSNKTTYSTNEKILINVELFDKSKLLVPDSTYVIKINLTKE